MNKLLIALFWMGSALAAPAPDAVTLSNLGTRRFAAGEFAQAESLYLRALDLWKAEHPGPGRDGAVMMGNLAAVYRAQARYAEAEKLSLASLDMLERSTRPVSRERAAALNNLAELYRNQGAFVKAEGYALRSVNVAERVDGRSGLLTADSRHTLAAILSGEGRNREAAAMLCSPNTPTRRRRSTTWHRRSASNGATVKPSRSTGAPWLSGSTLWDRTTRIWPRPWRTWRPSIAIAEPWSPWPRNEGGACLARTSDSRRVSRWGTNCARKDRETGAACDG